MEDDEKINREIQKSLAQNDDILYMIDKMFVIFKTEVGLQEALKINDENKESDEGYACPEEDHLKIVKMLKIKQAPMPSNIVWENYSSQKNKNYKLR